VKSDFDLAGYGHKLYLKTHGLYSPRAGRGSKNILLGCKKPALSLIEGPRASVLRGELIAYVTLLVM
jgi:hypothetical protein